MAFGPKDHIIQGFWAILSLRARPGRSWPLEWGVRVPSKRVWGACWVDLRQAKGISIGIWTSRVLMRGAPYT